MDQTSIRNRILELIRFTLWNQGSANCDWEVYEEMKQHSIVELPGPVLYKLDLPSDLQNEWKTQIYENLFYNVNYRAAQSSLPINVPYVILKGTTAAQYYPYPQYRSMGDIDIMTRRDDYQSACESLLKGGYVEETSFYPNGIVRHRTFRQESIVVEVHSYFAILNDSNQSEYLDDLIINNINHTHVLPDLINGLVILEHIGQHLENGIGLRQIIDWMMFVYQCLPDSKWKDFQLMVRRIGLEKLAITTTHMCEMYLGLPSRKWCANADDQLCERLMNYIFECGNFGYKREYDSFMSEKLLSFTSNPKTFFKLLQSHGLYNWKTSNMHPFLRNFAWAYQIGHYIRKTISRKTTVKQLNNEYNVAKERNKLFKALEISRYSEGLVAYKDGKWY